MRYLKWAGLGLFFVANLAIGGTVAPPLCSPQYQEIGDAGNRFIPQDVSGGPYCGIKGEIGEPAIAAAISTQIAVSDSEDAYRFHLDAGQYSITVRFPDPDGGNESAIALALYFDADRFNPIPEADSSSSIHTWQLLAGNYVLEFTYSGEDPPISAAIFQLDPGGNPTPIAAPFPQQEAPEPGVLALMLAGLAGLGALRRRAKAA